MIWIRPAAPGLRAAPSTADAAMRDWPSAPRPAAMRETETRRNSFVLIHAIVIVGPAQTVVTADIKKARDSKYSILNFLISIPPQGNIRMFKGLRKIKASEVADNRRTLSFIISPASGMQPPLVQRRSSDAKPCVLSTLESYDSRSSTPALAYPSFPCRLKVKPPNASTYADAHARTAQNALITVMGDK